MRTYRPITFDKFKETIKEHLELKWAFSFREIKSTDFDEIATNILEYYIKNAGCFYMTGYAKAVSPFFWFERETFLEEFDELEIEFNQFLNTDLAIDRYKRYHLCRFVDQSNFLLCELSNEHFKSLFECVYSSPNREEIQPESDEF